MNGFHYLFIFTFGLSLFGFIFISITGIHFSLKEIINNEASQWSDFL